MRDANRSQSTSEAPTSLIQGLEDAAFESSAVCFHGMHELHTSSGNTVWLLAETEDAVKAQYALAVPPWRLGSELPPIQEPIVPPKIISGVAPVAFCAACCVAQYSVPECSDLESGLVNPNQNEPPLSLRIFKGLV
jgi:hypothetical protein